MSQESHSHIAFDSHHYTYGKYTLGFILSLVLTFGAYFLVEGKILSGDHLYIALGILSIVQVFVQLIFFLHMMDEQKPRYNLAVFLFMALVIVIIVAGTLWIMANLNYRMMTPMGHT